MYYKIMNEKENHNGFQYKDGLNIDTIPFNPKGKCESGGLYYTTIEHVLGFLYIAGKSNGWIREVEIPSDAKTYIDGNKFKSDKIILGKKYPINSVDTFKFLFNNGANIHAESDYALRYTSGNIYVEVVKFLLDNGANPKWISSNNPEIINLANKYR